MTRPAPPPAWPGGPLVEPGAVRPPDEHERQHAMYDMYPEWGPTHLRQDHDATTTAVQVALDRRDNGGERPDDN